MFAIAPYAIELLDEEHEQVDLWNFYNNNNLRQVLIDYYREELSTYRSLGSKRLFRVAEVFAGSNISVAGSYETGEHGLESTIYDVEQRAISHEKGTTEADMFPFFFHLYCRIQINLARGRREFFYYHEQKLMAFGR